MRYVHNIVNYFKCPYENCTRLYHSKSDLKKHINNCHEISSSSEYVNDVLVFDVSGKVNCDSVSTPNLNEAPKLEDTNTREEISYLSDYQKKVNNALLSFISKLYNMSNLPRRQVSSNL